MARKKSSDQSNKKPARKTLRGPRLAGSGSAPIACYINADWRDDRMAAIYAFCSVPGGGCVMVSFLLDLDCIGLKDAFGQLNVDRDEMLDEIRSHGQRVVPIDLDQTRSLVAGAIRFSQQNHFRLPPNYTRWMAVLGGIEDVSQADISDFAPDGVFRYVGLKRDLQERLSDCSLDEFLDRPDVEYQFMDGFDADNADDLIDTEVAAKIADRVTSATVTKVKQWCFANGEAPHPALEEAIGVVLESIMQTEGLDEVATPSSRAVQQGRQNLADLIAARDKQHAAGLEAAINQFTRFLGTFGNVADFLNATGLLEQDKD